MANQTQSMECPIINLRLLKLRAPAEPPPVLAIWGEASSQGNPTPVNSSEGSPVHVHQFQYFEDDRCLGDIYLSMLGPVAFHCFRIDEWIPWQGRWQWVSDKRGIKTECDPDPSGDGPPG